MIEKIQKRNGELADFDATKIRSAMYRANIHTEDARISDQQLDLLTAHVLEKAESLGGVPTVEQIQDLVEEALVEADYAGTAKAYMLYRAEHATMRHMDANLMKTYENLTFTGDHTGTYVRTSTNVGHNTDTAMGTMLKYGSEGAKSFYDKYVIPPHIAKAHAEGKIHIHDKDFYTLTETCCQIDLIKLFHNGFSTGHGYLREPNAISSYAALACIAIQANQNEMHGGQSVPNFDYSMAQGVDKTYSKEYFKALIQFIQLEKGMPYDQVKALVDNVKENLGERVNMDQAQEFARKFVDYLPRHQRENGFQEITQEEAQKAAGYAAETAWRETDKATYQAMEALVHNLNTMNSRAGAQVPFSSLNYGTDTSEQGRMVIRNLLLATEAGLGDGETPIFPVQIFKVKEGVNYNEGDPNYDLFKLAMRVSAKRLFPNFSFLDAPFNLQYYKPGDYNTEVAYMGCRTRVMGLSLIHI